jgi:hypothetical protein
MAIRTTVELKGLFFKNPVAQLHRNVYDVLREASEIGAEGVRSQLQPGHGYLTGAMYNSVAPRLVPSTRSGMRFGGRARVVAGAAGHEPVRRYAGKIEQKYRVMRNAAGMVRSWADSNRGRISGILARRLS